MNRIKYLHARPFTRTLVSLLTIIAFTVTSISTATAGAGGGPKPKYFVDQDSLPFTALPGATALWGMQGKAGYRIEVPGVGIDNSDTVYQFDTNPELTPGEQELNDNIVRITQDAQGRNPNGLSQVPVISGDINIPVLTLHNLGDLFVPILNEVEYASRVAAHGKSDLLVQRAIRGVLHCDFTAQEFVTAFFDLVAWTEAGIKPAGDNFLDPAVVADPGFGCNFTNPPDGTGHVLAVPCP